jgi:hypothetical protein
VLIDVFETKVDERHDMAFGVRRASAPSFRGKETLTARMYGRCIVSTAC